MMSDDYPIASFLGTLTGGTLFVLIIGGLLSLLLRLFLKEAGFRHFLAVVVAVSAGCVMFIKNQAGTLEEALLAYLGGGMVAWSILWGISRWMTKRADSKTLDKFD